MIVINEESLSLRRNEVYFNTNAEKKARMAFKAAVERHISRKAIVIADSLNHIKGMRYELHCRAREVGTTHCLIYCDTPIDTCREWNAAVGDEPQYEEKFFEDLANRMEAPDAGRRWDQPLFTVGPTDDLPLKDIENAVLHGKAPKPSVATVAQTVSNTNSLYEIDRVTQEVVKTILTAQKNCLPGDLITIPKSEIKVCTCVCVCVRAGVG